MNLTHLKYALEVEKTGSITKAAENLFMGQPNLSRVIKDLEDETGIRIFSRTSKGIVPTENGRLFLEKARDLVRRSYELESMFKAEGVKRRFYVAGQSSFRLIEAFGRTASALCAENTFDCRLEECVSGQVMEKVMRDECSLGVMKTKKSDLEIIQRSFWERNLRGKVLSEFKYVVLLKKDHPLSECEIISQNMLEQYTLVTSDSRRKDAHKGSCLLLSSASSCIRCLGTIKDGFMISRPIDTKTAEQAGVVMCPLEGKKMVDLVIFKADHKLTYADELFINEFKKTWAQ